MVPYATSGTRLSAIGYADDGAVFFDTMRDTQLGMDCRFELSDNGDWLCAPTKRRFLRYLDATCSQTAVEDPPFTMPTGEVFGYIDPAHEFVPASGDTFPVIAHVPAHRIAEALFTSNGISPYPEDVLSLYALDFTKCIGPAIANPHVNPVPPSIFQAVPTADSELVKATLRDVPLQGGLTLERLVTDDGAQLSAKLELAGKECVLEYDGRCVPGPVAPRTGYVDADCTEGAFARPAAGDPSYGVEVSPDGTTTAYELSPIDTLYVQNTQVDVVNDGGVSLPVTTTTCDVQAVSSGSYYRRARDVTAQIPKLDTVRVGSASLFPVWFYGVLAGSDTRVLVQIHSPDFDWMMPNIATSTGSVCVVDDTYHKDMCSVRDGSLPLVPLTEVKL